MSQCTPIPTATQYTTVVSNSESTSFSNSITTLPASVTTITSESCLSTATVSNSTTCVSSTVVESVSTIAGGETSTVQVPVVLTIPVTQTSATATLYSTSCANTGNGSSPPPSSAPQTTTHLPESSTTTSVLSTSTPLTTLTTSQATTLSDGSVSYTILTITSTGSPTAVYVPTTLPATSLSDGNGGSHRNVALAPIIGGTIGGVVGLISIIGILWLIWRRRRYNFDDLFDDGPEDTVAYPVRRNKSRNLDLASEAEPKPYQYGLVGRSTPPLSAHDHAEPNTAPLANSPPLAPRTNNTSPTGHGRNGSLAPLMMPGTALSPGPSQPQTASSRPSTSGSMQPLIQASKQHAHPPHTPGVDSALSDWNPNTDGLGIGSDLGHGLGTEGTAVSAQEHRRRLQVANPEQRPMSPASTMSGAGPESPRGEKATYRPRRESANVVVHKDGGRVVRSPEPGPSGSGSGSGTGQAPTDAPPAYSD